MSPANGVDPHDLGFAGLIAAGYTPEEAWSMIRRDCYHPAVRAIIAELRESPEGRDTLEWSRLEWAQRGMTPPWDLP